MKKRVLLIGYGKMGSEIATLLPKYNFEHVCTLLDTAPEHTFPLAWTTSIEDIPWDTIDIAIDFSSPDHIADRCQILFDEKIPLIQGTTGWDSSRELILQQAQKKDASFVWSYNFSLGMSLFKQLVAQAARLFQPFPDFDIALMEAHHRKKKDAPSGTLLSLQETLLSILKDRTPGASRTTGELHPSDIDIATLRVGNVPGHHAVWIDGPHESIQLTHSARSRTVFAEGALIAASLLLKNPGVWHYDDLITTKG
jgi:4-hydroxy-tetrahydrodipicolinate reductase